MENRRRSSRPFTVTGTASLDGTLLVVPDGYTSGGSFSCSIRQHLRCL
jgi:hypothetical protein